MATGASQPSCWCGSGKSQREEEGPGGGVSHWQAVGIWGYEVIAGCR